MSPILQCDSCPRGNYHRCLESWLQPAVRHAARHFCYSRFCFPPDVISASHSGIRRRHEQRSGSRVEDPVDSRSIRRAEERMVRKGGLGAKRRCRPKLERLVRVLFGSHPRGRGIQTVRSISPSWTVMVVVGGGETENETRERGGWNDGCNNERHRKLLLLPSVYPYDSAANQRIRSSGSLSTVVRLSARSGSHPFPSVSQRRRARSQPAQRLTNRQRLSATRAAFRAVVSSIALPLPLLLSLSLSLCLSFSLPRPGGALIRITSMRD